MRIIILSLILNGFWITCKAQQSFEIHFNSTQPSTLVATTGENSIITGTNLVLGGFPAALGGTDPYTYQWQPSENLDNPTSSNPIFTGSSSTIYTLLITDNRGCVALDTIQIIITGLNDVQGEGMKIYPNPNSGSILIEAHNNFNLKRTTINLVDVGGRVVYKGEWPSLNQTYLLDVSKLAKGHYSIIFSDGVLTLTNKIILQ